MESKNDGIPTTNAAAYNVKLRLTTSDFIFAAVIPFIVVVLSVSTKSFWGDEIISIHEALQDFSGLFSTLAIDSHPPLYFLLLKLWCAACGHSEIALRAFQGIQGSAFLLLSLLLFRNMLPSRQYHPFWLILASSSELWLFMPMVRYYMLAACAVIFSSLMFFRWLESDNRTSRFLLACSYVLVLYTDYPASVVLLFHFLYVLVKYRARVRVLISLAVIAFLIFSPWIGVTILQLQKLIAVHHVADLNASPAVIPVKIVYSIYAYIMGEMIYPYELLSIVVCLILLLTLAVTISKKTFLKEFFTSYAVGIIGIGLLWTSLATTFVATHTSFIYTPSRALFGLPFLMVALGMAYSKLQKRLFKYLLVTSFALTNLYGISNWITNRHFMMPVYATPWKDVMNDLRGNDGIMLADESQCYEYYRNVCDGVFPELKRPASAEDVSRDLHDASLHSRPPVVFLITMGRESSDPEINSEILEYLHTHGRKTYERKYLLLDESYRNIKSKILGRDTYTAKLTLSKYEF